jgi:hypothetical protein
MRITAMIEINGPMGSTKFQRQRKLTSRMAALAWFAPRAEYTPQDTGLSIRLPSIQMVSGGSP